MHLIEHPTGMAGIAWSMVWPGMVHGMVYGMAELAWHVIWYDMVLGTWYGIWFSLASMVW